MNIRMPSACNEELAIYFYCFQISFSVSLEQRVQKIGAKVIKKMLKSKSFVEKNEIKEKTSEYCGKLELKVVILQCF